MVDLLAPPKTWSKNPNPGKTKMVELNRNDTEYKTVEAEFKKTLYSSQIKSIQRIESLSLWQVTN